MYLNNIKNIEITKIDGYTNKVNNSYKLSKEEEESNSEILKYLGDFKSKIKSIQLMKCKNDYYDIIFIKSYQNPDERNPISPEIENLKELKQKMNKFHLFLNYHYDQIYLIHIKNN